MIQVLEVKTLYNSENKPYYEVQVFLNTLCDLKWANNYAAGCHLVDRKQKSRNPNDKNEIELFYYFKKEKYVNRFIEKLKKYASYNNGKRRE